MKIERWNPDLHMVLVDRWCQAWTGFGAGPRDLYPPTGFVVDDCAVGFLYKVEGAKVAYIDSLLTDRDIGSKRRYHAIDRLCKELIAESDRQGVTVLSLQVNAQGLVKVCENNEFRKIDSGYTCLLRVRE